MSGALAAVDLLVVGAGPTGIAVGAEAVRAGLSTILVDRGPLVASLVDFPSEMLFFTTKERLEIAGIPFALPDEKPNRRQAIAYYQAIAAHYRIPLALFEEVEEIEPPAAGRNEAALFRTASRGRSGVRFRTAAAVAVATGYFSNPRRLGVAGEGLPHVRSRYREPLAHFGGRVVVVGGGNSAAEAALELFRGGARVTLVHRGERLKETIKYWVKPDLENRIQEGSISARFSCRVARFVPGGLEIEGPRGRESLEIDAAYVLIGYEPDIRLLSAAGVQIDPSTLVPAFDSSTAESNVPGLYVAGTVQAGRDTSRIFIENSRDHGPRIAAHLAARLGRPGRIPS